MRRSVRLIEENCEPALCTVLFMGGAGGSLRAGVVDNPVNLTRSVHALGTYVTSGGAPVYVWPGGGITFMVDVTRLPDNAFGYVPTPALVAPIEFTMRRDLYEQLGGHAEAVRLLDDVLATRRRISERSQVSPCSIRQPVATAASCSATRGGCCHERPADCLARRRQAAASQSWADRPDHRGVRRARQSVALAYAAAIARFQTILEELVGELAALRQPAGVTPRRFAGTTANRMERAVQKFWPEFITPMAAVAGSVADEIMAAMLCCMPISTRPMSTMAATSRSTLRPAARCGRRSPAPATAFADRLAIRAADPVRGIATSGWRGRSFSLGIADAVTVLAKDAAAADAAATLIANAVDLPGHGAIIRQPANELSPDSDLGERLVTTGVGALSPAEVDEALDRGAATAEGYRRRGLIEAAALFLNRESRPCGNVASASDVSHRTQRPSPPRLRQAQARHLSPTFVGARKGAKFSAVPRPHEMGRGVEAKPRR